MSIPCCDVLIIGAGPAGSTAGLLLARRQFAVRLIDEQALPREKICGDGLSAGSQHILHELGLYEKIRAHSHVSHMIELVSPRGRTFCIESPLLTIRRRTFDRLLLDEALSAGAVFQQGRFYGDVEHRDGRSTVRLSAPDGTLLEIDARIILLATGSKSLAVLRRCGFGRATHPDLVAVRGYCQADWPLEHPLAVFDPILRCGYFWIFPMGAQRFNVGCVMETCSQEKPNPVHLLNVFLCQNRTLREREMTCGGQWLSYPRGAMLRTAMANRRIGRRGNMLLLGEALGTTLPFSGEGIGMAMASGRVAADAASRALSRQDLALLGRYPALIRREITPLHRPYRLAGRLARIHVDYFLRFASRHAGVRKAIADLINGTVHPDDLFTLPGIWKIIRRRLTRSMVASKSRRIL